MPIDEQSRDCDFDHREVVVDDFFVSSCDSSEFFDPPDSSFNDIS